MTHKEHVAGQVAALKLGRSLVEELLDARRFEASYHWWLVRKWRGTDVRVAELTRLLGDFNERIMMLDPTSVTVAKG
jgi:hypothetical protein